MTAINHMELTEFCKHLAITGGSIALKNQPRMVKTNFKEDNSLLTEIDQQTEEVLKRRILDAYPTHTVIGEETGATQRETEYTWCIDPLDGTSNYVNGLPLYGTIVSVSHHEKILASAFYAPVTDQLFWAGQNTGGYCNDKKLKPSPESNPKKSTILLDWNRTPYSQVALAYFSNHIDTFRSLRRLGTSFAPLYFLAQHQFHAAIRLPISQFEASAVYHILSESGCDVFNQHAKPFNWLKDEIMIASSPSLTSFMKTTVSILHKG